MVFQLQTHDMERHAVELRMFVDKAKRRFEAAQMSDIFENILANQLPRTDENEGDNVIKIERLTDSETRKLNQFLHNIIDKCQRGEQHEALQEVLRKCLRESRRKSIVETAGGQAKEPICYFCGLNNSHSALTCGAPISPQPIEQAPAKLDDDFEPGSPDDLPAGQLGTAPADDGPQTVQPQTGRRRPPQLTLSAIPPELADEGSQLTPPLSTGPTTPDRPAQKSATPTSSPIVNLSLQAIRVIENQIVKPAFEFPLRQMRAQARRSSQQQMPTTASNASNDGPTSAPDEQPSDNEDSLHQFFVEDNEKELPELRTSTPTRLPNDHEDDDDLDETVRPLVIETRQMMPNFFSDTESSDEKKEFLRMNQKGIDRKKSRVTFSEQTLRGPMKRPLNGFDLSTPKHSKSLKPQTVDAQEAASAGINAQIFQTLPLNISKIPIRTPNKSINNNSQPVPSTSGSQTYTTPGGLRIKRTTRGQARRGR